MKWLQKIKNFINEPVEPERSDDLTLSVISRTGNLHILGIGDFTVFVEHMPLDNSLYVNVQSNKKNTPILIRQGSYTIVCNFSEFNATIEAYNEAETDHQEMVIYEKVL